MRSPKLAETGLEVGPPVSTSSCRALETASASPSPCSASTWRLLALRSSTGEPPQLEAARSLTWSSHPPASWAHRVPVLTLEPQRQGPEQPVCREVCCLSGAAPHRNPTETCCLPPISLILPLIRPVFLPSLLFLFSTVHP